MGTVAVTFDDYSTLTVTKTLTMVYEKKNTFVVALLETRTVRKNY